MEQRMGGYPEARYYPVVESGVDAEANGVCRIRESRSDLADVVISLFT